MLAIIKVETGLAYNCSDCIFKNDCNETAEYIQNLLGGCDEGYIFQVDEVERECTNHKEEITIEPSITRTVVVTGEISKEELFKSSNTDGLFKLVDSKEGQLQYTGEKDFHGSIEVK